VQRFAVIRTVEHRVRRAVADGDGADALIVPDADQAVESPLRNLAEKLAGFVLDVARELARSRGGQRIAFTNRSVSRSPRAEAFPIPSSVRCRESPRCRRRCRPRQ
jgi:hypothetical protein